MIAGARDVPPVITGASHLAKTYFHVFCQLKGDAWVHHFSADDLIEVDEEVASLKDQGCKTKVIKSSADPLKLLAQLRATDGIRKASPLTLAVDLSREDTLRKIIHLETASEYWRGEAERYRHHHERAPDSPNGMRFLLYREWSAQRVADAQALTATLKPAPNVSSPARRGMTTEDFEAHDGRKPEVDDILAAWRRLPAPRKRRG
jgi:hypothetical protein